MTKRPLSMPAGASLAPMIGIVCAAVLAAAALGASPAAAQEDNFTEQLLTTLGLVAAPPPDIEYRERAPLVVPPSGDALPAPRGADSITQNPAWPKDDDAVRRDAEAKAARTPTIFSDKKATRALTPAEVARGTNPNAGNSSRNSAPSTGTPARQDWLSLGQLGFPGWGGGGKQEKPLAFEGEPERETLTEPPTGYQTPAPGAAYGVVADRPEDKAWRLPDLFDRTQSNNDRH